MPADKRTYEAPLELTAQCRIQSVKQNCLLLFIRNTQQSFSTVKIKNMNKKITAIIFAIAAAVLYAVNIPFSKVLLHHVGPVFMASFLYLGAGAGMGIYSLRSSGRTESKLTRHELPYTLGMIILDIAAPILLMEGLSSANSSNVSLLSNFEIVATSVIALLLFKEKISVKMWTAVVLITVSSILLSFDGKESFRFSRGSFFVVSACICWGFENNCTRKLSSKNTTEIVTIKGLFSGTGSFVVAFLAGENLPDFKYIIFVLLAGYISYGLSIFLYVKAQKELGAAKTSAFYAASPFIGVLLSFCFFHESISDAYVSALLIMLAGTVLVVFDTLFTQV